MIITLVRADFSKTNIGMLDSFTVLTNLGAGLIYNGPAFVIKGQSFEASVSLNNNCTLDNFTVKMGGKTLTDAYVVNGDTITINIPAVTGIIVLSGAAEGDVSVPDVWYIDSLDALAAANVDLAKGVSLAGGGGYTPWAYDANFNSKLVGKVINAIEIFPSTSGKFSVGKVNATTFEYTLMDSFEIASSDVNTRKVYTFKPYTVEEGEFFTFNADDDAGKGYYYWVKDVSGVEGVTQLYSNCDSGSMGNFVHAIIPGFNIGYKSGVVEDTPVQPNPPVVEPEEPTIPDTPAVDGNTTWYIQSLKQLQDSGNDLNKKVKLSSGGASYSWAFREPMNNKLVGNTINTIQLVPHSTGDFYIGKYDTNTKTVTDKRIVNITKTDVPVTCRFDDLTINEGEFFVWNCSGLASSSEAWGYYIMKADVDPLAVETSGWYQAKSSGLANFSSYELAFIANIGYTAD